ncbi:hypothetical protein ABFS82_13G003400 [Erythranthe guttata]|uniref:uncharacterized protein LOC105951834 n=1 Tax=Erythranthe guttata TaxID=4155 RepID=UPI00064DA93B|nr:PREDICTED: uncharacterized protein LOC105951834 [Erythranthe guttata]|eukprot:XP_012830747.1 PREDICTED: uncharacterized protein LOC105951834 [Erythranthe guttata]
MGRQNKDHAVVGSSIALLQERFKQLQRLKEMREERQLLSLLPQTKDCYYYEEPSEKLIISTSFSTSDQSALRDPLALGLNSHARDDVAHFRAIKPARQFTSATARGAHSSFFEKTDVVDTSLRL